METTPERSGIDPKLRPNLALLVLLTAFTVLAYH